MKITVLADTHMPRMAKQLPERLVDSLKESDLIIHAGDWQSTDIYNSLRRYAPVEGVYGNLDGNDIRNIFSESLIIELKNIHIGITHGDGKKKSTEKRALDQFSHEDVDVIIFGHSHIPVLKKVDDCLLFNPGSPTDKRRQKQYSFGTIEVSDVITIRHEFYNNK